MSYRIVLVDDHALFRTGLRGLLEHSTDHTVVAEAASGEEFLGMLQGLEADLVFMDFSMPGMDGAETTERALERRPDLRIITLSMFGEESYYTRMVKAGACGFLLKDSGIDEVIEAIDTEDPVLLREELGDVLLQVVFHARIEQEQDVFGMEEVSNDICAKLIHRHPHVFGTVEVENSAEVLKNWEAIKGEEKQRVTVTDKLRAIPPMYPALMRAQKVGKKAACFDFGSADEVYKKLDEEIAEVKAAAASGDQAAVEEELGDLLLTVTSLARKLGVKSEEALFHATNKFIDRFERVENAVMDAGKDMETLTMAELDEIWDGIKHRK